MAVHRLGRANTVMVKFFPIYAVLVNWHNGTLPRYKNQFDSGTLLIYPCRLMDRATVFETVSDSSILSKGTESL